MTSGPLRIREKTSSWKRESRGSALDLSHDLERAEGVGAFLKRGLDKVSTASAMGWGMMGKMDSACEVIVHEALEGQSQRGHRQAWGRSGLRKRQLNR